MVKKENSVKTKKKSIQKKSKNQKENLSPKKTKKIRKRKDSNTLKKNSNLKTRKRITNFKLAEKIDNLEKRFSKIEDTLHSFKSLLEETNLKMSLISNLKKEKQEKSELEKKTLVALKKKENEKILFLKKIKQIISNEISQNFNYLNKKILSNFQNIKKIKKVDIKKKNFFSPILEDRNRNLVFSMKEIVDKLESKNQFTFGDINNFIKSNQDQNDLNLKVSLKEEDYDLLKENIEFCDYDNDFEENVKKDFEKLKNKLEGGEINMDAFCLK